MLYDDETYIREFASAAIQSFEEFSAHYTKYLLARDETNFRKAGHKIKPVALMLHIQEIINEYERAKNLLQEGEEHNKLQNSSHRMTKMIDKILEELRMLT